MKTIKIFGKTIFQWGEEKNLVTKVKALPTSLPSGRVSQPNFNNTAGTFSFNYLKEHLKVVTPNFVFETIPVIRQLCQVNPDFSQALDNMVQLGNTGHEISFDESVDPKLVNKMRAHLINRQKVWAKKEGGMQGMVNKFISQICIGGAQSVEWVPLDNLKGLKGPVLVNPETIRWVYDMKTKEYLPYQLQNIELGNNYAKGNENLIPLNTNTFVYYGMNGDTEVPYGIPTYLAGLDSARIQKLMIDNLSFLVEQLGLLGFLTVELGKPSADEAGVDLQNDSKYRQYLDTYLDTAKKRMQEGVRDGVAVAFKDDVTFNFHSTTKDLGNMPMAFELNEQMLGSGIKMDMSMLGRAYATTETQITVIFAKLLAQLGNIQKLVAANLEFGYDLELRLAGFQFNHLNVTFNAPTALDKLKAEQADEIKVRNLNALYNAGIISQEQFAHAMGYAEPSELEPRYVASGAITPAEAKEQRADQKAADKKKKIEKDTRVPSSRK